GIPAVSLVFTPKGVAFEAGYDVLVRALDRDERLLKEQVESRRVTVSTHDSTLGFHPYLHEVWMPLEPGTYFIQTVLIDAASGRQSIRTEYVRVPFVNEAYLATPALSIRNGDGARRPLLTSFVPENADSLRAEFQIRQPFGGIDSLAVRLLRVTRDTTQASPPYWVGPGYGTLAYQGIALAAVDTVLTQGLAVADQEESTLTLELPPLPRGLYRLEALTMGDSEIDPLRRGRYLVVTSAGFPRVETLDEMVDALGYIAYERELGRIREGATPAERLQRFDAFWGSLVRQRSVATNLIETYYARIEEANLLYSSYKEGWKTDRGMVYVLLGPPLLVDAYSESEVWRYSYGDDALYTFVFDRVRIPEADGFYENYILRRRPYYEHVWLQLVDRWRSGVVL
ncbi:MAG TPA: GWxTD domain-containing protein, partial [Rhodothermales bacterium]